MFRLNQKKKKEKKKENLKKKKIDIRIMKINTYN